MNRAISTFEADLDREYSILTDKHKEKIDLLREVILSYLKSGKNNPLIIIQGPYGSGKTQLLYQLFKFTYENGGIGVYTHLEKIIPSEEMTPLKYADYLREILENEVKLLKEGKSKLMDGKIKDYAAEKVKNIDIDNARIILFVDEIEQQYRLLDERVRSDDHSPMRGVTEKVNTGDAGFYLVLAFAPVSFYEFSKGEAQTRRYLPVLLPIVEPKTSRKQFGDIGNLVWWMGRGRYGWMLRVYDVLRLNTSDLCKISKKELQDVCRNMGSIGGVNVLEFEMIEQIDDFNSFKDFLIHLDVKKDGGEMYAGTTKITTECKIYTNENQNLDRIIENALKSIGISKTTNISYYLSIVLDALSTSDNKTPLFINPDDWIEALNLVEELVLEFEGESESRALSEDIKLLQDKIQDFNFQLRKNAEDEGELTEGYCITPMYLRTLFPFPTSSPNLIPDKKIIEQRENLADQTYLAREEVDGRSVFFFLNEDKIRDFLINESKEYLKETKVLITVNLSSREEVEKTKLAQWLEKEGRLKIVTPPAILSDFLVSFFYWLRNEKKESLPVDNLFKTLEYYQSKSGKNEARKISYYNSRIKEYLNSELPGRPSQKYILKNKTGFDEYKVGRVGFVPEILGFSFVDGKNDWKALYEFRKEFENTRFIRTLSTDKKTGVPSAIEKAIVAEKRGNNITIGAVLKRVKESFHEHLPDLREVVSEVSKDEFKEIPSDEDLKPIFEGIYLYLKEWSDSSKAEEAFRNAKNKWNLLKNRVHKLSRKMNDFEKLTDKNILLTHPLKADENSILNIAKILDNYQNKIHPYTKFLLSTFVEKTVEVIEPKLSEFEKRFHEFKESVEDYIKTYISQFNAIQNFDPDTFKWIGKKMEKIREEFDEKFKEICRELTRGGRIDLQEVPSVDEFSENIREITGELQTLEEIDKSIRKVKEIAQKINEKLKKWG